MLREIFVQPETEDLGEGLLARPHCIEHLKRSAKGEVGHVDRPVTQKTRMIRAQQIGRRRQSKPTILTLSKNSLPSEST